MKNLKFRQFLLLILMVPFSLLFSQTQKGELTENQIVKSEINPKEKHQYSVHLEEDQFAFMKLEQKGIDVKITTYDSKGEKIEDFDSPNGKHGPEYFSISSTNGGKYLIDIYPFSEDQPEGVYELQINLIKPKAKTPNDQVDELFIAWDNDQSPGAAVAVVDDGNVVYKNGYGLANLEYDIPISPSTVFHIASVSKQFTVFSILLLEKEGKLSLDDDVRKYIPEVPDFGKTITLRHLASHTSGLRDQWTLLSMAGWRMDDVITKEQILKLVSRQKDLNFDPGEKFLYCNTGFTLLAEVVARVSGMTFSEFTEMHIFDPLKMEHTLFYDDHEKIVRNRAYSYYTDSTGIKKSVLNYANAGATSLFTTVEDLSLWAINFTNPKVGDTTIIATMNTPAKLNSGKTFGGALGQFVGDYKGLSEIQHGGADAGYRSYLTRFPDEDFAVIVFGNSAGFNSGAMAHKVVDIYLNDKIQSEASGDDSDSKSSETISVAEEVLETYTGEYELQPGFIISITLQDGQLSAQGTGQPVLPLEPITNEEFKVIGVEAKIVFEPNGGEVVEKFILHQSGMTMDAPRIEPFDKDSVILSDFTGQFFSDELQTSYNFEIKGNKLIATHSKHEDIELSIFKKDSFSGNRWYFGLVEFIRDSDNSVIGCQVSSGRVQNLKFRKMETPSEEQMLNSLGIDQPDCG